MAPKKKPGRNGYMQFVIELKNNMKLTMDEAQRIAGKRWKEMSEDEKLPYKQDALNTRSMYEKDKGKLNSYRQPIDVLEQRAQQKLQEEQMMKEWVNNRLKQAWINKTIHEEIFLIIHMNKYVYHDMRDKYYICELAISAFNLKDGVKDVFHRIVKPGPLPLGLSADTLLNSKNTHQMFDLLADDVSNNTKEVFNDMIKFLKKYEIPGVPIDLYGLAKSLEMFKAVMNSWIEEFSYNKSIVINNLEYMLFVLKNTVCNNIWPTDAMAYRELDIDGYSDVLDIACEFHEKVDVTVYCSKHIVTRFAYYVCNVCCADLDIQVEPGRHVPKTAQARSLMSPASSQVSIGSSKIDWPLDSSSAPVTDYEYNSDNFPSLGAKPKTVSFGKYRGDTSSQITTTTSTEYHTASAADSDFSSAQGRFKHLKLPKKVIQK